MNDVAAPDANSRSVEPELILSRLREAYRSPVRQAPSDPVAELVQTILSQNTTDSNTERAFQSLRRRFPTWDAVVDAPTGDVADAIRSGGLANRKAPRIQRILAGIRESQGGFDLWFLKTVPVGEAWNWLTALPGVGPKTAACVLLFSLDQPVLPVDTHVHRVSMRLGLTPPRTNAEQAHRLLADTFKPDDRFAAHLLLIQHGRETCRARNPRCAVCVLNDVCPSAEFFLAGDGSDETAKTH